MKKLLLAGIALTALLAPAMAADMPVKARPAPLPPPPDWSGFYLGVHGGYGWKKDRFFSDECVFFCGKKRRPGGPQSSKPHRNSISSSMASIQRAGSSVPMLATTGSMAASSRGLRSI